MATAEQDQCCTLPPFKSDYKLVGKRITIKVEGKEDMEVYITSPSSPSSTKALVAIYDIFGFHNNTFQGADHLAQKCGFTIAMPDFFRGKGWKTDNIPPKEGRPAMQAYIQSIGSWELVRPDLLATIEFLKEEGKTSIGGYGFCFGGKKLAQAGEELFKAVALVHPTNLSPRDGDLFNVPVALIPSGGEDPKVMNSIWETLQKKDFAGKCVRKDFLDCHHGFASARSDYNDPRLAGRVREAYEVMAKFFEETL